MFLCTTCPRCLSFFHAACEIMCECCPESRLQSLLIQLFCSPRRRVVVTAVFVLGLEYHWLTLSLIKESQALCSVRMLFKKCAHRQVSVCPPVRGQESLSTFTPPFYLHMGHRIRWKIWDWAPPLVPLLLLGPLVHPLLHMGPIFIRARYETSHGQNNISVEVTGMWRRDESGIKIKQMNTNGVSFTWRGE